MKGARLTVNHRVYLIMLTALSMAFGWGWRGDYGHELGAMFPGAVAGMAVCIASRRPDWLERFIIAGFFGALGWSFGGSMSYGIVLGYTRHSEFWNVAYGFGSIFIIGALWGAAGGAFLGMALSEKRSLLNSFIAPMLIIAAVWTVLDYSGLGEWCGRNLFFTGFDVDWVAAFSAFAAGGIYYAYNRASTGAAILTSLSGGWILGFVILTAGLGLRMTPPRSDNWSGMIGLVAALFIFLKIRKKDVPLLMGTYGALYGGLGFSCGALFLTVGAVSGIPIDWWKIMEQFFGLVMGFGIAAASAKCIDAGIGKAEEDTEGRYINRFSAAALFLILLWTILSRNLDDWFNTGEGAATIIPNVFGIPAWILIYFFGAGISALYLWVLFFEQKNGFHFIPANPLGRSQFFFLVFVWMAFIGDILQKIFSMSALSVFIVQYMFALLVLIISFAVISIPGGDTAIPQRDREIRVRPGRMQALLWLSVPVIILLLSYAAVSLHDTPLPGSQARF